MRLKAEDVEVDDPQKAMERFKASLAKVVKAPKTVFRAKHKHTAGQPKKRAKR
jgi:hypothetical protein